MGRVVRYETNGKVDEGGKLHIVHRKRFIEAMKTFAGKNVEITVKVKKSYRTLSQNAYYWSVVIPHIREGFRELWGEYMHPEDVHHEMKSRFLVRAEVTDPETGEVKHFLGSTSDLSKSAFAEYVDDCIGFAAQHLDVVVPTADPDYHFNTERT